MCMGGKQIDMDDLGGGWYQPMISNGNGLLTFSGIVVDLIRTAVVILL